MLALLGIDWSGILGWLEEGIVYCVNAVIASIGALIASIVALLPTMPTIPSLGLTGTVLTFFNFGNYYFPIDYLITVVVPLLIALWIGWRILAIPLRWAKAVPGDQ